MTRAALAWFASDLHLDDGHPALTARFVEAVDALPAALPTVLRAVPEERPALFLLGDVFEVWLGDDIASSAADQVADCLHRLVGRGWRVFLMRGNRDFMLDQPVPGSTVPAYSARCGAQMLDDPSVIEVGQLRVLLSHGDAWCISDLAYQRFRAQSRSTAWQQKMLARPAWQRRLIGRYARWRSSRAQKGVQPQGGLQAAASAPLPIGVVDTATLLQALQTSGCQGVVHGHTHQPVLRQWSTPHGMHWLRVLPDWSVSDGEAPARGAIESLDSWLQSLDAH